MSHRFSQIEFGSSEYDQECSLRNEILRKPIGLDLSDEDRSWEASALHYGIFQGDELVACLIAISENKSCFRIRQMATKMEHRGQGIGSELMRKVESELSRIGATKIGLHARAAAIGFYERLGFRSLGEEFEEVNLPHVKMEKLLR